MSKREESGWFSLVAVGLIVFSLLFFAATAQHSDVSQMVEQVTMKIISKGG